MNYISIKRSVFLGVILALAFIFYSVVMVLESSSISVKGGSFFGLLLVGALVLTQGFTTYNLGSKRFKHFYLSVIIIFLSQLLFTEDPSGTLIRVAFFSVLVFSMLVIDKNTLYSFITMVAFFSIILFPVFVKLGINVNGIGYLVAVMCLLSGWRSFHILALAMIVFFMGARGAGLLLLVGHLIIYCVSVRVVSAGLMKILLSLVIVTAIFVQIVIAIQHYDSELLNELFTKRPLIWSFYLDEIVTSNMWFFTGRGAVDYLTAEDAGAFVAKFAEFSRSYGPHSSYILAAYEWGVLASVAFLLLFLQAAYNSGCNRAAIILLLIMALGFSLPIQIGGVRLYDVLFMIVIALTFRVDMSEDVADARI